MNHVWSPENDAFATVVRLGGKKCLKLVFVFCIVPQPTRVCVTIS